MAKQNKITSYTIIPNIQRLLSGNPLSITVTATISMGLSARATCGLDTYDMSPPTG